MEPADIMKLTMTVKEAREIRDRYPEVDRRRLVLIGFPADMQRLNMTPAQVQAALVLAWNEVLTSADASWLGTDSPADESQREESQV